MVSIDTAATTEIVFGGMGIELITAEQLCAAHQLEIGQGHRGYRRAAAATHGAITTANIVDSLGKSERQLNPATMATGNIVSLSHDNPCNPVLSGKLMLKIQAKRHTADFILPQGKTLANRQKLNCQAK